MTDEFVHVSAPARLHLGFLDPSGRSGRRFGGIGLALDAPATRLTMLRRDGRRLGETADIVSGATSDRDAERAQRYLGELRAHLGLRQSYEIILHETIPAHSGLGSGTQLALSIACGLRALEGLTPDSTGDADRLGRGQRSGLGAAFVTSGGLAVDGGKGSGPLPPPIVAAQTFPDAWRVILVIDPRTEGFHGREELQAFAALPAFAESGTAEICRRVLMQALPALVELDIAAFGEAIGAIQAMVGGHFAPAQGGVFTSPAVGRACAALKDAGAHGIGQSSWGPTGFAFAASQEEAERLVAAIAARIAVDGLDIRVVRGRNHGATVERRAAIETMATRQRTGTG